jgi:hypothetical protein
MKQITYTNTDEINDWLVKNFNDYLDTIELLEKKLVKIDSKENFEEKLKANYKANLEFKEERSFRSKYGAFKDLLILRNKDVLLKEIIDGYNNFENDDFSLLCYNHNASYVLYEIDSNYVLIEIVYNADNEPIGIKPFESRFINLDTYIVPLDGFENFVELHRIFKLKKWKALYKKYEHLIDE